MGHCCKHGHSCSCHSHEHCHSHGHENGVCSCCGAHHEPCGNGHHHGECDWAASFLELADEAWMEVLKEKIKEYILKDDKKITELAAIVSEANCERWKKKMEKEKCCDTYQQKLNACFNSGCSDSRCSK